MTTGIQDSDGFPGTTATKATPTTSDSAMISDAADSGKLKKATLNSMPYVQKAGDTMTGALILSGDPVTALGAVTKQYADAMSAGLDVKDAVVAASTTALTVTYANGASGVGATLTNAGAMAAFSLDGVSPTVGQRVLIKDQASTFQNGIYTVTTVGSGAVNWVLTRATDFDQVAEIFPGVLVIVTGGTTNGTTSWLQTATVATIGTDPITFIQFTAGVGANKTLSNLDATQINQSLISDTDVTDDLGSAAIRWNNVYAESIRTGDTAADVLTIEARDVDGASWVPFITITANNTPTCEFASGVTGVTQSASDNSTKLATTAYVDTAVGAGGPGTWVLIATATASGSASIDFTSGITSTYDTYAVVFETVQPATNGVEFWSRMRSGGTFRSTAGDYTWAVGWYTTAASGQNSAADTEITLVASGRPLSNTNTKGVSGMYFFTDPDSTTTHKRMYGNHTSWDSSSGIIVSAYASGWLIGVTTAVDGIQFLMSSGNISVGNFQLYGIKKT